MPLVKTTIDGRTLEVERDVWALEAARSIGISIPTLCHHPAVEPYGACRLCVVEVTRGRWTWLTTACDLPIREGLNIRTDTPAVQAARRMALELLWAQAPGAEAIQQLARQMGVQAPRFPAREGLDRCILCGLCVRVCKNAIGEPAVSFSHRGARRRVQAPFEQPSQQCIGCMACVAVCPTAHIRCRVEGDRLRMETWQTDLALAACDECGARFAPEKLLAHARSNLPEHLPMDRLCPACRRRRAVRQLLGPGP